MIELLGVKITYDTLSFLILFIASEVIGVNPNLKSNSVVQLFIAVASALKPMRKEDESIERIEKLIEELKKDLGA